MFLERMTFLPVSGPLWPVQMSSKKSLEFGRLLIYRQSLATDAACCPFLDLYKDKSHGF
jgi:hypothetical protein